MEKGEGRRRAVDVLSLRCFGNEVNVLLWNGLIWFNIMDRFPEILLSNFVKIVHVNMKPESEWICGYLR